MAKSPDTLVKWFKNNENNLLKIMKKEEGSHDYVELDLENAIVVLHKDQDEYLSAQALILNGKGTIKTDLGTEILPYDFYEIALTDTWSSETADTNLYLHTERGSYEISAENRS